ncbi:MAG: PQQ-binding-like beta-propeller repeat protein [Treponema sp.]|nr:PQQ-binding-like beta-propeller repeat protein [Treponema sp.]
METRFFFLCILSAAVLMRLPALGIGDANTGGNHGAVRAAYHPGGGRAAVSFKDGTIGVWDIGARRLLQRFPAHANGIWSLSYSPGGDAILSTGFDGFLRVWNTETAALSVSHFDPAILMLSAAWNHRGDRIVLISALTGQVQMLNAADGEVIWNIQAPSAVYSAAFSPDDTLVAVGDGDYLVRLLDAGTGAMLRTFDQAHNDPVSAVSFSPDGSALVSADSMLVCVWDVERGAPVYELDDFDGFAVSAAFNSGGTRIMAATNSGVYLWDAGTGRRIPWPDAEEYGPEDIADAVFSPGGESVLAAETNGLVWIYDAETGKRTVLLYDDSFREYEFTEDDINRLYREPFPELQF